MLRSGLSRSVFGWNWVPPVWIAIPLAVLGSSCIRPTAPASERAFALKCDSL